MNIRDVIQNLVWGTDIIEFYDPRGILNNIKTGNRGNVGTYVSGTPIELNKAFIETNWEVVDNKTYTEVYNEFKDSNGGRKLLIAYLTRNSGFDNLSPVQSMMSTDVSNIKERSIKELLEPRYHTVDIDYLSQYNEPIYTGDLPLVSIHDSISQLMNLPLLYRHSLIQLNTNKRIYLSKDGNVRDFDTKAIVKLENSLFTLGKWTVGAVVDESKEVEGMTLTEALQNITNWDTQSLCYRQGSMKEVIVDKNKFDYWYISDYFAGNTASELLLDSNWTVINLE